MKNRKKMMKQRGFKFSEWIISIIAIIVSILISLGLLWLVIYIIAKAWTYGAG